LESALEAHDEQLPSAFNSVGPQQVTETLSVRLSPDEAKRVFELSVTGRRTVSQTLRMLLERALDNSVV
jgi:hypothetical protein